MLLKTILFTSIMLLIPITTIAGEPKSKSDVTKIESMNIEALIEKAKEASSAERIRIEDLIKKKIAQAHRANSVKG